VFRRRAKEIEKGLLVLFNRIQKVNVSIEHENGYLYRIVY
jgi:hypothetical protein